MTKSFTIDGAIPPSIIVEDTCAQSIVDQNSGDTFYFDSTEESVPTFSRIAIGGTFDQLYNGHKKLLTLAAGSCSDTLIIGITGDDMLKMKAKASKIVRFPERKNIVETFLRTIKPSLKIEAVELHDPFGPAITDPTIQAIVVSSETISGAKVG